jgi:glycosyltransferase involved in cell wall biosynthesis
MQNAAIYLHPNGFDTNTGRLLGRHSAGESFLRGFMAHADVERFDFWNILGRPQAELEALVNTIHPPTRPVRWIGQKDRRALQDPGVVSIPSPTIGREAWHRRTVGRSVYSICGLTHTTATERVMDTIADLLIAPTEAHDALICTSTAVRASVECELDGVRAYLAEEYGPRRRPEPVRATIPLGVNAANFTSSPEHRQAWRERLDIPQDAPVALFVGRFNTREKMNPGLMAVALEKAAQATGQTLYWVNSGWAETEAEEVAYHRDTRALCPSVRYIVVDGRPPDTRFSIWSVADFFISFSDNIQETFGLTPVEAMAAGLPSVVTDWNGYKDTVRHGLDGFRVPTIAPQPGAGGDLAFNISNGWMSYTNYVGAAAQFTAIDYAAAVEAISALVTNPELRAEMGANARTRAREVFDWSAIIPQYQALWGELNERRRALPPEPFSPTNPFRPDPFSLFANYPTRHIGLDDRIALPAGVGVSEAVAILQGSLSVYSGVNRPTGPQILQALNWLSEREGGTVGELMQLYPRDRQPFIRRGVLWMARLGAIELRPPA